MPNWFRLFRKPTPLPQEVLTEKILAGLDDIKHLTAVLQSIFNIETLLRHLHMALDPRVQAALDAAKTKISDAITKEIQEVKDLVTAGADPSEVIAALDDLGTTFSTKVDEISSGGPAGGSPGNTVGG